MAKQYRGEPNSFHPSGTYTKEIYLREIRNTVGSGWNGSQPASGIEASRKIAAKSILVWAQRESTRRIILRGQHGTSHGWRGPSGASLQGKGWSLGIAEKRAEDENRVANQAPGLCCGFVENEGESFRNSVLFTQCVSPRAKCDHSQSGN